MTTDVSEELLTGVEWKTLSHAFNWDEVPPLLEGEGIGDRAKAILRVVNELREDLRKDIREARRTFARLTSSVKTPVAAYYVKLVAMRPLRRIQVLLRQKLASSASVERLILRNRPRQLFAACPPIAPPYFA